MGHATYAFHTSRVDHVEPAHLISGIRLETEIGWMKAEDIVPGMSVQTLDGGLRRVLDVELIRFSSGITGHYTDGLTLIPGGVLSNCEPFYVLPQQELLLRSPVVEDITGQDAALVRAEFLEGFGGIARVLPADDLSLVVLSFSEDEIVWANTGALIQCAGLLAGRSYLSRPGPAESLRIATRMFGRASGFGPLLAA